MNAITDDISDNIGHAAPRPSADGSDASDTEFLNVTLWAAQAVVGFAFCFFGLFKLTGPMAELVQEFKWPGDYPAYFTRALGLIDIVGGIGLVLPALTRILPRVGVAAARCAVLLQLLAIAFHASRGEWSVLPLNLFLLPLAVYVAWGRHRRVAIAALQGAPARSRALAVTLWAAQIGLAVVFIGAGLTKFNTPMPELVKMMPWTGAWPTWAVRGIGLVDIAGGLGVLLPALTRILPRVTVLAAVGCVLLQVMAVALHLSRGEFPVLPLNAALLAAALYVAWGRHRAAPIGALRGPAAKARFFSFTLWTAQAFVAVVFIGAGMFKVSAPIPDLAAAMKWPGDLAPPLVRLIGAIDIAGGLGILLPALTRIRPRLSVLAALGCSLLQLLAIAFHASRGEWAMLPLNFALLPCALYVLWGRSRALPVMPSGVDGRVTSSTRLGSAAI